MTAGMKKWGLRKMDFSFAEEVFIPAAFSDLFLKPRPRFEQPVQITLNLGTHINSIH